jgi:hypothetical protein
MSFLEVTKGAHNNITPDDSVWVHVRGDGVGNDSSIHRELDWGGVNNAYVVARSRSLDDSVELAVAAILGVKLDHLLVVVRSLKKLNPGVEGPAISRKENLDTVNTVIEWVCAQRSTLHNCRGGQCLR